MTTTADEWRHNSEKLRVLRWRDGAMNGPELVWLIADGAKVGRMSGGTVQGNQLGNLVHRGGWSFTVGKE